MYGTLQGKKSYLLFIKLKSSGETILFKRVLPRHTKMLGEKNNLENVMQIASNVFIFNKDFD